jgi:hypothetical protein
MVAGCSGLAGCGLISTQKIYIYLSPNQTPNSFGFGLGLGVNFLISY